MSLQIPQAEGASSPSQSSKRPVSSAVAGSTTASPTSPGRDGGSNNSHSHRHHKQQQRASHQVVSSSSHHQDSNGTSTPNGYTDVYSHPAAVAYAAQHPRRTIPKFGPYLLLQTLGEGEFGKVKLGLHSQWGEEVAVKLIRRGNVDSQVRMSKVEREIEVLRSLKHPNIVRLYDVIETDKYIGIILEYASGGELFDHILAHRYLRERDAARLFSQLISGVWYIHKKKIVHRDLKLENLLLDRNRNVIITDFGFANRFEHKSDDLMQTSCGSPCYAAPELVISEGLYVGSAVDIWSCGVILYAMLAGYLPFDDDPANPDGDNINLLYKYIVNTPLSFPDYVSESARDMLRLMLVPDPRRRASLQQVMAHPWLAAHQATPSPELSGDTAFGKTVQDLEKIAMEMHQVKRNAYQKQMRLAAQERAAQQQAMVARSVSNPPLAATPPHHSASSPLTNGTPGAQRTKSHQPENGGGDYLYQTSPGPMDVDDPFAGPASSKERRGPPSESALAADARAAPRPRTGDGDAPTASPAATPSKKDRKEEKERRKQEGRHTIQVEYDTPSARKREKAPVPTPVFTQEPEPHVNGGTEDPTTPTKRRRPSQSSQNHKPLPTPPSQPQEHNIGSPISPLSPPPSQKTPPSSYSRRHRSGSQPVPAEIGLGHPSTPTSAKPEEPETPITFASPVAATPPEKEKGDGASTHTGSSARHRRLGSISGGIKNILARGASGSVSTDGSGAGEVERTASSTTVSGASESSATTTTTTPAGTPVEQVKVNGDHTGTKGRKRSGSKRNTINLVVGTIKRSAGRMSSGVVPSPGAPPPSAPPAPQQQYQPEASPSPVPPSTTEEVPPPSAIDGAAPPPGVGMQASTSKAKKVMQWFRGGRSSMGIGGLPNTSSDFLSNGLPHEGGTGRERKKSQTLNAPPPIHTSTAGTGGDIEILTTPASPTSPDTITNGSGSKRKGGSRTPSDVHGGDRTPSFVTRFRQSVTVGGSSSSPSSRTPSAAPGGASNQWKAIRIHHGPLDQTMITSRSPPEVMKHVREVLESMGASVSIEGEWKVRCVRAKRPKGSVIPGANGTGELGGVEVVHVSGSAGSGGVDRRGLPIPGDNGGSSGFGSSSMLRGLLRRGSSQVTQPSQAGKVGDPNSSILSVDESPGVATPIEGVLYGPHTQDAGNEVRFSVELTRLDRLKDTYSLDVRRLKGDLRSYKWLYEILRERANLG